MELKEYQNILKELLYKFDEVCKKNNVQYFLFYGTLIGAVRHKSFIPWDDDLDIILDRNNYNKLMNISQEEWGENFEIENLEKDNNNNWCTFIVRLIDKRYNVKSTIRESIFGDFKSFNNPFLDIFIMDNDSNNVLLSKLRAMLLMIIYVFCLGHRNTMDLNRYHKKIKPFIFIGSKIGKIIPLKYLILLYKKFSCIFNNEKNAKNVIVSNIMYPFFKCKYEKKDFIKSIDLYIDNKSFPGPIGYDSILKVNYKDYMILPDEENRKPIHKVLEYKNI